MTKCTKVTLKPRKINPKPDACNLCGGLVFADFNNRSNERCKTCGSLIRHRIAYELYRQHRVLNKSDSAPYGTRILHLAPERLLHAKLKEKIGAGYLCSDSEPEKYRNAQCLKVFLPRDLDIFPADYFDFILHNHVMEHLPGEFREHFPGFLRILKPGGKMIFSVPGPDMTVDTVEGGEHMSSDEERIKAFGQFNHFRRFGRDLVEFLMEYPGASFAWDGLTDVKRASLGAKPKSNRFMVWSKDL